MPASPLASALHCAPVAQWIRRRPSKPEVVGSIPTGGVNFKKKAREKKIEPKKKKAFLHLGPKVEERGIDPRASRMLSERSTI